MDMKYPHWYHGDDKMDDYCDCMEKDMICENYPYKPAYPVESLKDRILCFLGDEVLFSVDARLCGRESLCGTLCYVGCDFIIVNTCIHRKPISLHVPIKMLRFIAPFKGGRRFR